MDRRDKMTEKETYYLEQAKKIAEEQGKVPCFSGLRDYIRSCGEQRFYHRYHGRNEYYLF